MSDVERFAPPADVLALLDEVYGPEGYVPRVRVEHGDVLLLVDLVGSTRSFAGATTANAHEQDVHRLWRFIVRGVRTEIGNGRRRGTW